MEFFIRYIQQFLNDYFIKLVLNFGLWIINYFENEADEKIIVKHIKTLKNVTFKADIANKQHYELPTEFFEAHLGKYLKYSSCEWNNKLNNIDQAEVYTLKKYQKMLKLDDLENGDTILEVGNGWGSLCIRNALDYPHLNFESFSNSKTQIEYINKQIKQHNIKNLIIWKNDIEHFVKNTETTSNEKYARIVSIECIEHCINYELLFHKFSKILKKDGYCFIQILGHSKNTYIMNKDSWMGRNFFTGGVVPSMNLFEKFDNHLIVCQKHIISGIQYSKTLDSWLDNMYINKSKIMKILNKHYPKESDYLYQSWRMFYLMSSVSFSFNDGNDYCLGYFIMKKK